MRTALGQYAHLVAIMLFVVGPAWAFHPLVGLGVAWASLLAWTIFSAINRFDEALGNFMFDILRKKEMGK